MGKQCQTLFWGAPKPLQMVTAAMKLKDVFQSEGEMALHNKRLRLLVQSR